MSARPAAWAGLGLLDDALALDLRRPQDYFHRMWSTAFRTSRTAAAIRARRARTQTKIEQVRAAITILQRQRTTITVVALVRQAAVSRTFLYENPEARALVAESIHHDRASRDRASALPAPRVEDGLRDRALNAEAALKDAHSEIRTQRNRIGQLIGHIRDLETHQPQESAQCITVENTALKERLRLLPQDKRTLEDRLQAARSNTRFLDRRISQLEAQLLERDQS
ncbi:DUF6262 family protein [Streptomyces sp. NPDC050433]|uniref:DUF6262 family protein n=1 Tax=Streptomyces sp. NPDC050433 TaxID=3365615 RepID=UPI0037A45D14